MACSSPTQMARQVICIKTKNTYNTHIHVYHNRDTAMAMKKGWKDKHKAVGRGAFASPNGPHSAQRSSSPQQHQYSEKGLEGQEQGGWSKLICNAKQSSLCVKDRQPTTSTPWKRAGKLSTRQLVMVHLHRQTATAGRNTNAMTPVSWLVCHTCVQ